MEERGEPLLYYKVKRVTEFGQYTAIVTVDKETRLTHIKLYKGEPVVSGFWGLLKIQLDPIRETNINPATDVNRAITKLIVDWELPFYQQHQAEISDSYLVIDHEEELKKRRARLKQQEEEERELQAIYRDWQDDKVHVLGKKTIHPNSLANLKQYQDKKQIK